MQFNAPSTLAAARLAFTFLACCGASIVAQIQLQAQAVTAVGCYAEHATKSVLKTFPPNTIWKQDLRITASADFYNSCTTSLKFRGATALTLQAYGGALRGSGSARSNTTRSNGRVESHSIALTFRSPKPVTGRLVVRLTGAESTWSNLDGAVGASTVTIGTTRVTLRTPSLPVQSILPLTIGPNGVTVFVETLGGAQSVIGAATYQIKTELDFFAGSCVTYSYGSSCASLVSNWKALRTLRLTVSSGARNGFGVALVGTQAQAVSLPVPYLGCRLLLKPLFILAPFVTDAQGSATHDLVLPPGSGRLLLQDLLVFPFAATTWLATTNGIEVDCK